MEFLKRKADNVCFLVLFVIVFAGAVCAENSNRQREVLEANGRVIVEWEVNFADKTILFDVTAETTGFVGVGLSPVGGMAGSDIVIGGIYPNGTSYFKDYHAVGDFAPLEDTSQDWRLLSAFENSTHTFLRFTRLLDSCDPEDVPIGNDTLSMIWALGHEDAVVYHGGERGSVAMNLLDPPQPKVDISAFKSWKMTVDVEMPSEKSYAYWCTIYKGPAFGKKTHVVGFRPLVKEALAIRHTHHFVIYRCTNPPGTDATKIFGPFADIEGDNCYTKEAMARRPSQMCGAVLYVWGAGGKEMFLPDHVGYTVGLDKHEYFMLEIHYDNPHQVKGAKFETGVEVFYTDKLRKYDAGMMTIGHTVIASLMIPPRTKDFQIVGHCSGHCTKLALPPTGMHIFNILMHTHLQGRRMRLRQFRNGTELPWVSNDDHYNFQYQKNRPLREERVVLPGDALTFQCHYDTSNRDTVTTAGYSTRNEMCESFIWYYPKLPFDSCASFYPIEKLYEKYGIKEVEWQEGLEGGSQPIIKSPASMANKTFSQVLDAMDWTPKAVDELQKILTESDHQSVCSGGKHDDPPPPPPPGFKSTNDRGQGAEGQFPPQGPPPGFKSTNDRGQGAEGQFPPQGPPPGFNSKNGPPPGFDRNGPPPPLPPELQELLRVNYPKLDKEFAPPPTCGNDRENAIDS